MSLYVYLLRTEIFPPKSSLLYVWRFPCCIIWPSLMSQCQTQCAANERRWPQSADNGSTGHISHCVFTGNIFLFLFGRCCYLYIYEYILRRGYFAHHIIIISSSSITVITIIIIIITTTTAIIITILFVTYLLHFCMIHLFHHY